MTCSLLLFPDVFRSLVLGLVSGYAFLRLYGAYTILGIFFTNVGQTVVVSYLRATIYQVLRSINQSY